MSNADFTLPEPDADDVAPYTLVGQARARPGQEDALERVLLSLVAPTRREAGALEYHVHRDRADPCLFVFYEAWQSLGHLKAHLQQPYIIDFLSRRMDYLAEDMDVRWLKMASSYAA
ncbi:putative quinol monooxygenase [Pararhizobium polonicum]|uniref:putative quinol monooxygenase n=1 Tax=Pararhizobium polonicum TaxID=1612624 RepID=UPI0009F4BC39|nr:putative quinol monooxygenase [Pararhizobium polonicum]